MDALKHHLESGGKRPVVSKNSETFLGPECFSAAGVSAEAAGAAQSLRFGQIGLASP
jgi:hypothetical protein